MACVSDILNEIEERVKSANVVNYSIWCVAVTSLPAECQKLHHHPPHFMSWKAHSPELAQKIKESYMKNGMKEAFGGPGDFPQYIFIF